MYWHSYAVFGFCYWAGSGCIDSMSYLYFRFAIIGFFFWRAGRQADIKLLNKITGWILVAGLVSSIGFLVGLMIRD